MSILVQEKEWVIASQRRKTTLKVLLICYIGSPLLLLLEEANLDSPVITRISEHIRQSLQTSGNLHRLYTWRCDKMLGRCHTVQDQRLYVAL